MSHAFRVLTISLVSLIGMATICSAQGQPQPGDVQQKLEQELANTKRAAATESSSAARQSASDGCEIGSRKEVGRYDSSAQEPSRR